MSTPKFPSNGLTLVSLFAGCGGSSLGYRQAGFDIRLAVEWNAEAVDTYRNNFPETKVFKGDISNLSGHEALELTGLRPGELDVLDGSPPCQGFSTAGKRQFFDSRNVLFEQYVRLLKVFQPRAFVMENVSGLIKGKMKLAFAEMTLQLKSSGYKVSCRLLNAWWYGVPQDRRRLIWIGIREDIAAGPSHPEPIKSRPISVDESFGSIRRSFGSIRNAQFKNGWKPSSGPAPTLESMRPPMIRDGEADPRYITIEEAKILQGIPNWFAIQEYGLIGNSVAPPMAKAIGCHVAKLLAGAAA